MSDLMLKEARLTRVSDRTGRNLLEDPVPLEATLTNQNPVTVTVDIANGPEAAVQLLVSSDQDWLIPQNKTLSLVGGQVGTVRLTVNNQGKTEFANLCLQWRGLNDSLREYILVWRKLPASKVDKPKEKETTKGGGSSGGGIGGWMVPCVRCEKMIMRGVGLCEHCGAKQR